MYIKKFDPKKVIISDGKNDYELTAVGDQEFDYDTIEDIITYEDRVKENK